MAGLDPSDVGPRPEGGDHDVVTPPGTPTELGERLDPEEFLPGALWTAYQESERGEHKPKLDEED